MRRNISSIATIASPDASGLKARSPAVEAPNSVAHSGREPSP